MVLDQFSLEGQVGIVTGDGQGLGRVFCQAFAEAGADVVIRTTSSMLNPNDITLPIHSSNEWVGPENWLIGVRSDESVSGMKPRSRIFMAASKLKFDLPTPMSKTIPRSCASCACGNKLSPSNKAPT